jgi:hypothetical protein
MHVTARCGGDDCDDRDPNRYGGNREVCDAAGHDEDCDPLTYGHLDVDGDGFDDIRCYNRDRNGRVHAGTDFDDLNPAIHRGSMVCDGPDGVIAFSPAPSPLACPTETKCVVQPNLTGICIVPPANYVPPPRWVPPATPGALPPLETLISPANMGLIQQGIVPTPTAPQPSPDPQTKIQQPVAPPPKSSAGGNAAEVAQCRSVLESGKIFWGASTTWAPENIDKLCNGTTNAKATIECFESNVEKVGWTKAIDKCK